MNFEWNMKERIILITLKNPGRQEIVGVSYQIRNPYPWVGCEYAMEARRL